MFKHVIEQTSCKCDFDWFIVPLGDVSVYIK